MSPLELELEPPPYVLMHVLMVNVVPLELNMMDDIDPI